MSDTVWVAAVAALPGIVASVLGYLNQREIRNAAVLAAKAAALGEKTAALGAKNEQHLAETKVAMVLLEKNTNSIKDELVKVTGEKNRQQGNIEGRAELKAENDKAGESEEHF